MKKLLALALALSMLLTLAACGRTAEPVTDESEAADGSASTSADASASEEETQPEIVFSEMAYTFGYAPPTMSNSYWQAVEDGVLSVCNANGVDVIDIEAESDQSVMNDYVDELIHSGVNAILMAPVDMDAAAPALEACAEAGIPVIGLDTAAEGFAAAVTSDQYGAGVLAAQEMMIRLPEHSSVFVMNQPEIEDDCDRLSGFLDTIGTHFDIVGTETCGEDAAAAQIIAKKILTDTPDLTAFFCVSDNAAMGCTAAAVELKNRDVMIYGVNGDPAFMGDVAMGNAAGSAALQATQVGAAAANAALRVLSGEGGNHVTVPFEMITTINAGSYDLSDWQ